MAAGFLKASFLRLQILPACPDWVAPPSNGAPSKVLFVENQSPVLNYTIRTPVMSHVFETAQLRCNQPHRLVQGGSSYDAERGLEPQHEPRTQTAAGQTAANRGLPARKHCGSNWGDHRCALFRRSHGCLPKETLATGPWYRNQATPGLIHPAKDRTNLNQPRIQPARHHAAHRRQTHQRRIVVESLP